jgi:N6-adenosine-specific RNA methylase IME4
VARDRKAYEARKEKGGTAADLEALATSGYRAGVIYADPPWLYETLGDGGKLHTSADNHYDVQTLNVLCDLGHAVQSLAAENSVLFLWATWPLLLPNSTQDGVTKLISAWGFEYKTGGFLWEKTTQENEDEGLFWGNGFWTRANSEPCLLCTRGNPRRLAFDVHQVVRHPALKHSEKPEEVAQRIERLVAGPYLELFARKARPGWVTWGDEVPAPTE